MDAVLNGKPHKCIAIGVTDHMIQFDCLAHPWTFHYADFIEAPEGELKRGDRVKAWDEDNEKPRHVTFLAYIKGAVHPYICTSTKNIEERPFGFIWFKHAELLPEKKYKPCPFCDKTDIIIHGADLYLKQPPFWCECKNCGACGPEAETQDKAVELWNRREESE
jgi:Lar family restriction alleviation protein